MTTIPLKHISYILLKASLFFFIPSIHAQSLKQNILSLHTQLQQARHDTTRVMLYNDLAYDFKEINQDSALYYATKALSLSQKTPFKKGEALSYVRLGLINHLQGEHKQAWTHYKRALRLEKELAHAYGIARAENHIAQILMQQGHTRQAIQKFQLAYQAFLDLGKHSAAGHASLNIGHGFKILGQYDTTLYNYLQARDYFQQENDNYGTCLSFLALGNFHRGRLDTKQALSYYQKSLALAKSQDMPYTQGLLHFNIALILGEDDKLEPALQHLQTSHQLFKMTKNYHFEACILKQFGLLYHKHGDLKRAQDFYTKSLRIANQDADTTLIAEIYQNQGLIGRAQKKYPEALGLLQEALQLQKNSSQDNLKRLSLLMHISETYIEMGQYEKALGFNQAYIQLHDSLTEKFRKTHDLKQNYELKKIQTQLFQKEAAILKAEHKHTILVLYAISLCFLLLLGLLISALILYRSRQKVLLSENFLLEKQKEIDNLMIAQEIKTMEAMIEGQEQERDRIAQDIHDRAGALFSLVRFNFQALDEQIRSLLKIDTYRQFVKTQNMVEQTYDEIRNVANDMFTGVLRHFGLVSALEELKDKIESAHDVKIHLVDVGFEHNRLESSLEVTVYRVVQELLCNVLKHAYASEIEISLYRKLGLFSVSVEDNGVGFQDTPQTKNKCKGLLSIKTRLQRWKGHMRIDSTVGRGTLVMIEIPLNRLKETNSQALILTNQEK